MIQATASPGRREEEGRTNERWDREEGRRGKDKGKRMRDALWFCSALCSPGGLPVQQRMEGRGGRGRNVENQKKAREGKKKDTKEDGVQ